MVTLAERARGLVLEDMGRSGSSPVFCEGRPRGGAGASSSSSMGWFKKLARGPFAMTGLAWPLFSSPRSQWWDLLRGDRIFVSMAWATAPWAMAPISLCLDPLTGPASGDFADVPAGPCVSASASGLIVGTGTVHPEVLICPVAASSTSSRTTAFTIVCLGWVHSYNVLHICIPISWYCTSSKLLMTDELLYDGPTNEASIVYDSGIPISMAFTIRAVPSFFLLLLKEQPGKENSVQILASMYGNTFSS
mmetsp:Transcript_111501/g.193483  ORF Transcript_111501/g.193483 Transcript_111501/m.193483 type:complete len:249 (-) Transcript_111501:1251-1997(-)